MGAVAAVDWIILAVIALSALVSVVRGFVKEAFSLTIWLAAFVIASLLREDVAPLFSHWIALESLRSAAAWVAILIAVLLVGALVNYLLGRLVTATGLSGTDRLLGLVFGTLRGGLMVLAATVLLPQMLPVEQDPWWQESKVIPLFRQFEGWGIELYYTIKNLIWE